MLSYTHFTLDERKFLQQLLSEGYSLRKIASFLGRSPSSVSREVKRNRSKHKPHRKPDNPYWYNSWRAQNLYIRRRRQSKKAAIPVDSEQWNFAVARLLLFWSPETICGRWRLENPNAKPMHKATLYRYIARKFFPDITRKTHLRRRGKRKVDRTVNCNTIQPDRTVLEWPDEIKNRTERGHFEGDTVLGKVGTGGILSFVDRASRHLFSAKIDSKAAEPTRKAIVELLRGTGVKSITLDNGCEFAQFRQIEEELGIKVYFAEPHKPWQRGTNENTNGLLRFFFPKGCDFSKVTQEELDHVVEIINNRPRKCLGWRTPAEVFYNLGVALG